MNLDKADIKQISGGYVQKLDGYAGNGRLIYAPFYAVCNNETHEIVAEFETLEEAIAVDERYHLGTPAAKKQKK